MEINQKYERKRIQQAANTLERLIRLERKNAITNFHPLLYKVKTKTSKQDAGILKSQIRFKDQMLHTFWDEIDKNYFKRIAEEDVLKLDWIFFQILSDPDFPDDNLYPDYQGFLAMHTFYEDLRESHISFKNPENDDQFFYNLMKHYYVTIKCYLPLYLEKKQSKKKSKKEKKEHEKMLSVYRRLLKKRKYASISVNFTPKKNEQNLKEEGKILDKIIEEIKGMEEVESDYVQEELTNLTDELEELKGLNKYNIAKLREYLDGSTQEYLMRDTLSRYRKEIRGKTNSKMAYNLYLQESYLRKTIFDLERKQIAENIKSIIDVKLSRDKEVLVEVVFDSSVTKKTAFLKDSTFFEINRKRSPSLLKIFNNLKVVDDLCGRRFILKNEEELDLGEIMKLSLTQKRKWKDKIKEWEPCHHCKKMIHVEDLYQCSKKIRSTSNNKKTPRDKSCKQSKFMVI